MIFYYVFISYIHDPSSICFKLQSRLNKGYVGMYVQLERDKIP